VAAYQAPQPASAPAPEPGKRHNALSWVGPYGGVVAVCTLIWAISSFSSGHLTYFWPVWTLIPLILGVFGRAAGAGLCGGRTVVGYGVRPVPTPPAILDLWLAQKRAIVP
jgi:hypothetical protein